MTTRTIFVTVIDNNNNDKELCFTTCLNDEKDRIVWELVTDGYEFEGLFDLPSKDFTDGKMSMAKQRMTVKPIKFGATPRNHPYRINVKEARNSSSRSIGAKAVIRNDPGK